MKSGVVAIVPAAGRGRRLGLKTGKPFVRLAGLPLIAYTLKALEGCNMVDAIVIATEESSVARLKAIVRRHDISKVIDVIAGGRTRHESVANCLGRIGGKFGIVVIHDGARPLVDKRTIEDSIRIAAKYGACVAAVPESDTIKLADDRLFVRKTLDRSRIFRAQTPQAFRYDLIKKAYSVRADGLTDDAAAVEACGGRVRILRGSYRNIKITTIEDLKLAKALI
jgi:2-C-methyl-D-erythritol 4-phosphate cytidylyltransferase